MTHNHDVNGTRNERVEKGPGEEGLVEKGPDEERPGEEGSVEEQPVEKGPGEERPVDKVPVEEGPGEKGSGEFQSYYRDAVSASSILISVVIILYYKIRA